MMTLSVSGFAAGLQTDALNLCPTGLAATKAGALVAALEADGNTLILKSTTFGELWTLQTRWEDAHNATLWRGFSGEMRLFFNRGGDIYMSVCPNPDMDLENWSTPVFLANGLCSSAPIALRGGAVLLPVYLSDNDCPGVLFSIDRGDNWVVNPSAIQIPEKIHNRQQEPILVPYRNGRILMLCRAAGYQWRWGAVSRDFGRSWNTPDKFIYSPDTPMSVTVLPGGRWLCIKNGRLDEELHYTPSRLVAYLSEDEGETWYGDLMLDKRADAVSPCVCAPGDGNIYILYVYKPLDGHCCEINCVRTSEVEISNAAASRNVEPARKYQVMASNAAQAKFRKEVSPYQRANGKPSGAPIAVASYNIEYRNPGEKVPWASRLPYINEIFRTHNFDVVGVQEPYRPEYDDLCRTLGDAWGSIFACTNLENDDFSNSIFYRKERMELMDNGIFWYTEMPGMKKGFGGSSSRLCIWAKMKDKTSGNIFFIFNSHFDFVSYEAMMTSSRLLISKVREIAGGYPAICTGDYNSADDNPAMKLLAGGPYLQDSMTAARKAVNPEMTTMGRYNIPEKIARSGYHIDHIFFTPGLSRVDRWEILCEQHCGLWGASDHNPIKIQWQILK